MAQPCRWLHLQQGPGGLGCAEPGALWPQGKRLLSLLLLPGCWPPSPGSTGSFCVWVSRDMAWLRIPPGSLSCGISDSSGGFRAILVLPIWVCWEDTCSLPVPSKQG